FKQSKSFAYLDRLTFIRGNDYIRMYIRLIVLGSVIIYFVPSELLKIIMGLLLLYMSNFQLVTLYHHHRTNMLLDLYSVPEKIRSKNFLRYLIILNVQQTILYIHIFIVLLVLIGLILVSKIRIAFTYLINS